MRFQSKLFSWPEKGNHLILIARGLIDIKECREIFDKIAEMTRLLVQCKVIVELADAMCEFQPVEIDAWLTGSKVNSSACSHRIALVSPAETEQYDQWLLLSRRLSERGFQVAVFRDIKTAISWLGRNS